MFKNISIIGLGAIGGAYINQIVQNYPIENIRVIAGGERARRYAEDGVKINGQIYHFQIVQPSEKCTPADLLIFSVKFHQLDHAIREAENHVGPDTIILSLLNGITSEEILGSHFGKDKVLYSLNAGIDAVRVGNDIISHCLGTTYFGEKINDPAAYSDQVLQVKEFFDSAGISYIIPEDMMKTLWWKFMLNVGVNQTSAVLRVPYGVVQQLSEVRSLMVDAMQEVVELSQKAGIHLGPDDLNECLRVIDGLTPSGKTSMCQDVEASRQTEVDIFAGTVVDLGQKYGVPTPVNSMLLRIIKATEEVSRCQSGEK